MTKQSRSLSYPNCVIKVLQANKVPLTIDALMGEIGKLREVGSGGRSAVYRALKNLYQAVPVDTRRYGWLTNLLHAAVLRHPLTNQEIRRGFLMMDELEHAVFFPEFFQNHTLAERKLMVQLFDGPVVPASAFIEKRTWSLRLGTEFSRWVERLGGQGGDNLIIRVDDAPHGLFTLRLQPAEAREVKRIEQRNMQIALAAESVVAAETRDGEPMPTAELAARLIARGLYRNPVPPDELHFVLHRYSGLHYLDDLGYGLGGGPQAQKDDTVPGKGHYQGRLFSSLSERDLRPDDSVPHDMNEIAEPEAIDPDVEDAMRFLGWELGQDTPSIHDWLDQFVRDAGDDLSFPDALAQDQEFGNEEWNSDDQEELCNAYLRYIERLADTDVAVMPLSHHDFHLVAAELEYMLALEDEFGDLLPDQLERKQQLAARLLLDPDSLSNDDLDIPDYPDLDDPPYWDN